MVSVILIVLYSSTRGRWVSPLCVVLISFAHTQVRPAVVSIQMIIHSQCLWGEDTLTLLCVCVCVCVCVVRVMWWLLYQHTSCSLLHIAITVVKCFEFLSIISLFLSPSLSSDIDYSLHIGYTRAQVGERDRDTRLRLHSSFTDLCCVRLGWSTDRRRLARDM